MISTPISIIIKQLFLFRTVYVYILILKYFSFFKCLLIFEREREHEQGWGRERGDRGTKAGSVLRAVSTMWARTHPEPRDPDLS